MISLWKRVTLKILRIRSNRNYLTYPKDKIWLNRRELFKKYYFGYLKGGIINIVKSYGRSNICRVKPEGEHSNHPKE
jgi:hypothetical protein